MTLSKNSTPKIIPALAIVFGVVLILCVTAIMLDGWRGWLGLLIYVYLIIVALTVALTIIFVPKTSWKTRKYLFIFIATIIVWHFLLVMRDFLHRM